MTIYRRIRLSAEQLEYLELVAGWDKTKISEVIQSLINKQLLATESIDGVNTHHILREAQDLLNYSNGVRDLRRIAIALLETVHEVERSKGLVLPHIVQASYARVLEGNTSSIDLEFTSRLVSE